MSLKKKSKKRFTVNETLKEILHPEQPGYVQQSGSQAGQGAIAKMCFAEDKLRLAIVTINVFVSVFKSSSAHGHFL